MNLRTARKAAKLTQAELDRKAGVGRNTTSDIERGINQNPSWKVVRDLVAALHKAGLKGVTAEELMNRSGHETESR